MLSAVKLLFFSGVMSFCLGVYGQNIRILVVGESMSNACGGGEWNIPPSYRFNREQGFDGVYSENNLIDCDGESLWVSLGKRLTSTGFAERVSIVPIGVGDSSIKDWLPNGREFRNLSAFLDAERKKNMMFDYAFWYQDSIGSDSIELEYASNMSKLLKLVSLRVRVNKWIISRHSICGALFDHKRDKVLTQAATGYILRRYPGPSSKEFGPESRLQNCQLNDKGRKEMIELWHQSMMKAEKIDAVVQKETLLKYFK